MRKSVQTKKLVELEGLIGSFPNPDNDLIELFSNTDFSGLYLIAGVRSRKRREDLPVPVYFNFNGYAEIEYQKTEKHPLEGDIADLCLEQWSYEGLVAFKAGFWKLPSGRWHLAVYIKTDYKEDLYFYGRGRLTIFEFENSYRNFQK